MANFEDERFSACLLSGLNISITDLGLKVNAMHNPDSQIHPDSTCLNK